MFLHRVLLLRFLGNGEVHPSNSILRRKKKKLRNKEQGKRRDAEAEAKREEEGREQRRKAKTQKRREATKEHEKNREVKEREETERQEKQKNKETNNIKSFLFLYNLIPSSSSKFAINSSKSSC